jgi:NADH/NAD ratio-sensing transcriptional regulator Rex
MATELIDKDYISIKVSKKIGTAGIRRLQEFARFLEINKDAPKKVSKKKITELANEITAASWVKFKKKHNLQ